MKNKITKRDFVQQLLKQNERLKSNSTKNIAIIWIFLDTNFIQFRISTQDLYNKLNSVKSHIFLLDQLFNFKIYP